MSKVYSNIRLFSQTILRSAFCLALALSIFTAVASAATYTVDTTVDNLALTFCTVAPNDCSLRGAISSANATPVPDLITFELPAGSNTITLTTPLVINNAATAGTLIITNSTGPSNLLISGFNFTRVFFVNTGANLTLNGITVTNGRTPSIGGGIYNDGGTLSLTNSTVSGNTADNGGGIYNQGGTTTLTNSTVSGNTATTGGGIYNDGGTLSLTNSTVSGNTASAVGGIYNFGTLNLTSVTVAFNSATSVGEGVFTVGGGVFNFGTANLSNTIVAKNSAQDGPDFGGAISQASAYNLIGNGAGMSGITNGTGGNQVGTPINPIDPLLAPLAIYGGTTPTHPLLIGSPAIDRGFSFGSATDQRGLTRPVDNPSIANAAGGDGADIGAYEVQFGPTAASVNISGRVTTQSGRGIRNVLIILTDSQGNQRTAISTTFGYYRFDNVTAGETVTLSVKARQFRFNQSTIVRTTNESINDADFVSEQ
jgi:hypothetical protein